MVHQHYETVNLAVPSEPKCFSVYVMDTFPRRRKNMERKKIIYKTVEFLEEKMYKEKKVIMLL